MNFVITVFDRSIWFVLCVCVYEFRKKEVNERFNALSRFMFHAPLHKNLRNSFDREKKNRMKQFSQNEFYYIIPTVRTAKRQREIQTMKYCWPVEFEHWAYIYVLRIHHTCTMYIYHRFFCSKLPKQCSVDRWMVT